ncbi:MAG: hypothetical protein PHE48_04400 [Candidatus Daviesbacteria bacterium]|nr:hypothetical protein [Candidatus Daviesbacteria bacterium]
MERARYLPEIRRSGSRSGIGHEFAAHLREILAVVVLGGLAYCGILALHEHQRNQQVSSWAATMREKLNDPSSMLPGEKYYSEVRIVAAGADLRGQYEMKDKGTLVDIRDHPTGGVSSEPTGRVIGQIIQDGIVNNVILTNVERSGYQEKDLWGVFNCADATGAMWENGKTPKPDQVCAIDANYLLSSSK